MNLQAGRSPASSTSKPARQTHNFSGDDTAFLLRGSSPFQSRLFPSATGGMTEPASRLFNDTDMSFMDTSTMYAGREATSISLLENRESLEALHEKFHCILENYKDKQFSFDLVKEFIEVCQSVLPSQARGTELEKWVFEEKNTWNLLQILMEDRFRSSMEEDENTEERDYPVSEKEVMEEVFHKDAITRQCQLVVDWLEACEADKRAQQLAIRAEHFADKTNCWENTILQLTQKDHIPYSNAANIVTQLDPDAPVRENLPIHKFDAHDESLLLSQILSHIRCGQLEQAQKLCCRCGQPWRAATLDGWQLYHDPNIGLLEEGEHLLPTEGNPNRDIWKVAAWRLAEDKRMPLNARSVYAVLCGHLEVVLINMATWHDWLWAYLKAMIDVRIEEEIRLKCSRRIYVDMPMNYWANKFNLSQIFSSIAASPEANIRSEHCKEINTIQRLLILDDMNTLFASLSQWSRQINDYRDPLASMLLRFSAHLVLALRSMGKEENESCVSHGNEVLTAYTKFIISQGNVNLIMSFVSKLPRSCQIATLAQYLETVADPEKKALCMDLALREGLDAEAAAQRVVENMRMRQGKATGELQRGQVSEQDLCKIEALDWLVVYPSQYLEALWQANALVRQFIALGKLSAASAAFEKLPPGTLNSILQESITEFPDIDDLDAALSPRHRSAVREYLSLKLYLDAQDDFSKWLNYFHQQKPTEIPPLRNDSTFQQKLIHEEQVKQYNHKLAQWKKGLSRLAKESKARLFNILTFPDGGWLGCRLDLDDEIPENASRKRDLEALCRICIPEAALLIHEISVKSGEPQCTMQLADIIACERYGLARLFSKEKAREILNKISNACVDLLKAKKDPWGHQVTS